MTAIPYHPRRNILPVGFWDFLGVGMGGYIGGRSLEKITNQIFGTIPPKTRAK